MGEYKKLIDCAKECSNLIRRGGFRMANSEHSEEEMLRDMAILQGFAHFREKDWKQAGRSFREARDIQHNDNKRMKLFL